LRASLRKFNKGHFSFPPLYPAGGMVVSYGIIFHHALAGLKQMPIILNEIELKKALPDKIIREYVVNLRGDKKKSIVLEYGRIDKLPQKVINKYYGG
jgi:predicted nucleic acid-binding protein